jgi:hypothetical protein
VMHRLIERPSILLAAKLKPASEPPSTVPQLDMQ